jgi:hypothetical protein
MRQDDDTRVTDGMIAQLLDCYVDHITRGFWADMRTVFFVANPRDDEMIEVYTLDQVREWYREAKRESVRKGVLFADEVLACAPGPRMRMEFSL